MTKAKKPPAKPNHSYNLRSGMKAKETATAARAKNAALRPKKSGGKAPAKRPAAKKAPAKRHNARKAPPAQKKPRKAAAAPARKKPTAAQKKTTKRESSSSSPSHSPPSPPAHRCDSNGNVIYAIEEKVPEKTLQDLKGMDDIQKAIKAKVIGPFAYPRQAQLLNLKVPRGVLLTGLPGTGKTALADAIVSDIRSRGMEVKYYQEKGQSLSKYVGETEASLRLLFKTAKDTAPSVIFLDELDGLGMKRSGDKHHCHNILTTLLTELNDLPRGDVLLIAATNCPQLCDQALIRTGRFDAAFEIPLPGPVAREQILQLYLDNIHFTLEGEQMEEIKTATEGSTGSDLESLVSQIQLSLIDRMFPCQSYGKMEDEAIMEVMEELELDMEQDIRPHLKGMKRAYFAAAEE